jgi:hypothetical protein
MSSFNVMVVLKLNESFYRLVQTFGLHETFREQKYFPFIAIKEESWPI